jgi:hypothetical protein
MGRTPNTGWLFLDWLLSPVGQKAIGDYLYPHSIRTDARPPLGGLPISQLRLLLPEDWHAFLSTRPEFAPNSSRNGTG